MRKKQRHKRFCFSVQSKPLKHNQKPENLLFSRSKCMYAPGDEKQTEEIYTIVYPETLVSDLTQVGLM